MPSFADTVLLVVTRKPPVSRASRMGPMSNPPVSTIAPPSIAVDELDARDEEEDTGALEEDTLLELDVTPALHDEDATMPIDDEPVMVAGFPVVQRPAPTSQW